MTMLESVLPKIPDDLVQEMYEFATTTPKVFVRNTAEALAEYRPYLLHSYLVDGLRISADHGGYDTLHYFRQVLFIPAILDQYSRRNQKSPLRVSRYNLESLYAGLSTLTQQERNQREIILHEKINKYSPVLTDRLEQLANLAILEDVPVEVQTQAYKKAFRAFELYEMQILDPAQSSTEGDYGSCRQELPTDPVPMIRSSVVDLALLDLALDIQGFTMDTVNNLRNISTGLTAVTIAGIYVSGAPYALTSSFINRAFLGEYKAREKPAPNVTADTLNLASKEATERMKEKGIEKELTEGWNLLKKENPHLFYGIALLEKVLGFNSATVRNAVQHSYRGWRNQAEQGYWDSMIDKS